MSDLRHRLDAAASTIEPDPDLWASVEHRLVVRRRRPVVLVAIAAAAAVAAAVLIVPRVGHQPSVRVPAGHDESGTWRSLPSSPLPYKQGMQGQWLGHELVVFDTATGAGQAYDPVANSWRMLRSSPLSSRVDATQVAAGDRLLIWGGRASESNLTPLMDGALYDPASDTWTPVAPSPLSPRTGPYVVWTGAEVILWNGLPPMTTGTGADHGLASGAAYDPVANTWRTIPDAPDEAIPVELQAVWTGSEMVVLLPDAVAYNPTTNAWRAFAHVDVSSGILPNGLHAVVDPAGNILMFDRGPHLYDRAMSTWLPMPSAPVVSSVGGFDPLNAVMTDHEIVAWGPYEPGGGKADDSLTTGEAFDLGTKKWRTFPVPTDAARGFPVSVWTGSEVVEWGGLGAPDLHAENNGWVYTPPVAAQAG